MPSDDPTPKIRSTHVSGYLSDAVGVALSQNFDEREYRIKIEMRLKMFSLIFVLLTGLILVLSSVFLLFIDKSTTTITIVLAGSGVLLDLITIGFIFGSNSVAKKEGEFIKSQSLLSSYYKKMDNLGK